MYPFALFLHISLVMLLLGVSVATDSALSLARRQPDLAVGLRRLVSLRLLNVEAVAAVGALVLGLTLLLVNPAGMAIFKTGMWIHLKVTFGLLGIMLVFVSRFGITEDGKAGWVQPVRGIGQASMLATVFAAEVLRMLLA
ncbi:MAG TPA: hypothetical protein PKW90_06380 [Myxococcota bacterium]|nr:hypothetical protein [Myxococcota bacterium]